MPPRCTVQMLDNFIAFSLVWNCSGTALSFFSLCHTSPPPSAAWRWNYSKPNLVVALANLAKIVSNRWVWKEKRFSVWMRWKTRVCSYSHFLLTPNRFMKHLNQPSHHLEMLNRTGSLWVTNVAVTCCQFQMFFDLFWTALSGNPNICWWCRIATPACTPACGADTKHIWPLKAKRSFAPRDDRSYVRLQRHGWWWFLLLCWGQGIGYLINYQLWNLDIYLVTWCDCGVVMMVFYTEIGGEMGKCWFVHDMQSRNASCFSLLQWHFHCTCLRQEKTMPTFISCGVAPETWSTRGITAFWRV